MRSPCQELPVLLRLFLLFTLVPLIELYLLVWLATETSLLFTVVLVVFTGALGAWLARRQGWQAWRKIHEQLGRGEAPTAALVDALLILVAGVLLITPGMLTDACGFSLLVPPFRNWIRARLADRFRVQSQFTFKGPSGFAPRREDDDVIDVEFSQRSEPERRLP